MQFPRCRHQFSNLVWLALCCQISHAQHAYWTKKISTNQKLVVFQKEVPYVPPSSSELERLTKAFKAKVTVKRPAHMWEYSLIAASSDGKKPRLIWQKNAAENKGAPKFRILDAHVEGNSAVVLYWSYYTLFSWVGSDVSMQANRKPKPIISIVDRQQSGDLPLISAQVKGSFKTNSIALEVQKEDGPLQRFAWRNHKWVEQAQKNGKWANETPAPTAKLIPLPSQPGR